MHVLRLCKATLCLALATFALIVAYDNLIDYGSNYAFVQHVLGMDTVFPESVLKSRAIVDPTLWKLGYAAIIASEFLVGLLLLAGGVMMLSTIKNHARFLAAKNWAYVGGTLGFLVWFLGFMVVGGEWFGMWQSTQWNGIESAFRFNVMILGIMIFVSMPEPTSAE